MRKENTVTDILKYLKKHEDFLPLLFLNLMIIIFIVKAFFVKLSEIESFYNGLDLSIFIVGLMLYEKLRKIEKKMEKEKKNENN